MDYGIPSLAMFSETGELNRFPNSSTAGLALFNRGADTSPEWRQIAITDVNGLETALSGLVHSHPYLPLAGGVMTGPISSRIIENYGRYYGVAFADFYSDNITTIVIETGIAANSTGGTIPSSEDFYQVTVNGISHTDKSKTLDVKIGLSIKTNGSLSTTTTSGWSTFGTIVATNVAYKVVSNKYVLVLTIPEGKYYVWVDVASKYITVRDNNFVDNLSTALGSWSISSSTVTGTTNLSRAKVPITSFASGSENPGYILTVDTQANGYAPKWIQKLPVSNGGTGATSLTGILVGNGTNAFSTVSTTNANGKFLKCTVANNVASYSFEDISSSLPPITGLVCDSSPESSYTNRNQMVLFRNTNYNGNPSWSFITASDIYGAPRNVKSVLISEGADNVDNTSSGTWLDVTLSSTPKFLGAKEGSNNGLRFYTASEMGIDIPSAYNTAAEPIGETASPGLSSAYSRGDHIHPLPYTVPSAERLFFPRKIGIIGAITAEAIDFDGTGDVFLNALRIDPYFFETAVPVTSGGTGLTSLTENRLLIGKGTGAIGTIANVTSTSQFLRSNGTSSAPSFQSITWEDVTSKPSTFSPSAHDHTLANIKNAGTASKVVITNPNNTAGEAIGTTEGAAGQVLAQITTGTAATVGWITPRMRDVHSFYLSDNSTGTNASTITHTKGHDTMVYIVNNASSLGSGQDTYTCEVNVPTASGGATEGDQIELHLVSLANAGITGKLRVQVSAGNYSNLMFMKNNVIVNATNQTATNPNVLECGKGQYIVLRAIAVSQSDKNYGTFNWLAKVMAEVN